MPQPTKLPTVHAPADPAPVLLVTAFYPISRSRYPQHQYQSWMRHLLSRVTGSLYMFTTPDMAESIRSLRGSLPIYLNTSYASVHDIPVIKDLLHEFPGLYTKSREAQRFAAEMSMIRTAKPWFLSEALRHVIKGGGGALSNMTAEYRYAFWMDAGGMRENSIFSDWPSVDRLDYVWEMGSKSTGMESQDLMFVPVDRQPAQRFRYWQPSRGPIQGASEFSEGTFFGGPPQAIYWWTEIFYKTLKEFLIAGHLIESERGITNAVMFMHATRFITVYNRDPTAYPTHNRHGSYGYCGDPWYYFTFFLAHEGEREEQNVLWNDAHWRWDFWRKRRYCRMARPLTIKDVLRRTYGSHWTPPTPPIPNQTFDDDPKDMKLTQKATVVS
ncbi:hypothetical protein BKA62DRAFT_609615 [Auriculariales sp. MPI-PUGE-AT-0066]|nr:hypothetical protein BKA62DRAFT_609615 [Auriculariales sp. MPI-PUGE-AT-0066]